MDKNGAKWQHPLRTQEQNAGTDLSRPPPKQNVGADLSRPPSIDRPEEHELPTSSSDASLYDRYAHVIFAYVQLHTPSREDAEDLTLEVFMAALEHDNLSGLPESEQLAWLRRVAHNKLVDSYRHASRHPFITLEHVEEALSNDESQAPEQVALRREEYERLYKAIRSLSTVQQQVLRLRYGDGLRFAEIAVLLNKREEAVRKLLSRTLSALRTIYKP